MLSLVEGIPITGDRTKGRQRPGGEVLALSEQGGGRGWEKPERGR